MQNAEIGRSSTSVSHWRVGVSPAYFVSAYGEGFGPQDVVHGLSRLAESGFASYQPEIFDPARLPDWTNENSRAVSRCADDLGVEPSQFVAHFLGHGFASPSALEDSADLDLFLRSIEIARLLRCTTVVIPFLPFAPHTGTFLRCRQALLEKLGLWIGRALEEEIALAVELVPGGIVASTCAYVELCHHLPEGALGISLDTGNAHSAGEVVPHAVDRAGSRICGVHLCDNDGGANLSARPGTGTLPWAETLAALNRVGYKGTLDLEIRCPKHRLEQEYTQAQRFVMETIENTGAAKPVARSTA